MDCDWLEDYGIDACLWIGTPGQWGAEGITNLLTGKANPSGHLIDTYASNSLSAPATVIRELRHRNMQMQMKWE